MSPSRLPTPFLTIEPRGGWQSCIVAATGPSLTPAVAAACHGTVIAVNDAYRLLSGADVLYACDAKWWDVHGGCRDFAGERWSSHEAGNNDKLACAERYGLSLVAGAADEGFSLSPERIHYGSNSGFQAINLAILFGATRIALVGFDMHTPAGRKHFFGDHPAGLVNNGNYERFIPAFERAAAKLPAHIRIINCTPGSALRCFPMADLAAVFDDIPTTAAAA